MSRTNRTRSNNDSPIWGTSSDGRLYGKPHDESGTARGEETKQTIAFDSAALSWVDEGDVSVDRTDIDDSDWVDTPVDRTGDDDSDEVEAPVDY